MKKLNRKGFTLIELLAVVVIMAIILVVTVPTIINSISDARVSSIWNLAKSAANSYDTIAAQDLITTGDKTLKDVTVTTDWTCISDKLAGILDLSSDDVVIDSTLPTISSGAITSVAATSCSAIRLKSNGAAEVLLVAKDGGKFDISGKVVYGLTSDDNGTKQ